MSSKDRASLNVQNKIMSSKDSREFVKMLRVMSSKDRNSSQCLDLWLLVKYVLDTLC